MEIIKCCPFCGSHKVETYRTESDIWQIACADCGANAQNHETWEGAVANWNRRYYDDVPSKIIEKWKCGFCDDKTEVDCNTYRTDWKGHVCPQDHVWRVCPKCQEAKGDEMVGWCPEHGEYSLVLKSFNKLIREEFTD